MQEAEITGVTKASPKLAGDIWALHSAHTTSRTVLISWMPPSPGFLEVNFDGSVDDEERCSGVGFAIRDHDSKLVAAHGRRTFDSTVVCTELRAAWEGIYYARRTLGADHIILECDSATVVEWIQRQGCTAEDRLLIHEICRLMEECDSHQASHVFREANEAVDWVASYTAHHSGGFVWVGSGSIPGPLCSVLFSNFVDCIHIRSV
ncbi:uncharacterized protein LOC120109096 [Phoenix dactylifera]|uniref:Uncharacterized protein LOC120109096 n=1 Tax=Phoenix dactylifera TaxID=42345 RepID=A0A8B8ZZG6_PHODC|nr:uncharacterized protein LOC120109096 [Phoenix dactylifera]